MAKNSRSSTDSEEVIVVRNRCRKFIETIFVVHIQGGFIMNYFMKVSGWLVLSALFLSSSALANWTAEKSMNVAQDQLAGGVINGKIYVFGGDGTPNRVNRKSCEVFDPTAHLWTSCASNEHNKDYGVEEIAGAVVNGKLYVFGAYSRGTPYEVFVEEYDPVTNIWTSKASMPTSRAGGAAAVYNGEIYILGGYQAGPDPRSQTKVVEAYNPVANSWRTNIASMPIALSYAAAAVVGNKAYVLGGAYKYHGAWKGSSAVLVYDFLTDTWTTEGYAPLPLSRVNPYSGTAPVHDNKIYLIGGIVDTGTVFKMTDTVAIYDTVTNTWSNGPSLPEPRSDHFAVVLNNTIYIIGGDKDSDVSLRSGASKNLHFQLIPSGASRAIQD